MTQHTDAATAVNQLREQGFAVLQGLIEGDRLSRAARDAEALMETTPIRMPGIDGPIYGRMCKGLFKKTRAFDDLYVNPVVLSVIEAVLAGNFERHRFDLWGGVAQLSSTMLKDVVPREAPRYFHQDDGLYPMDKSKTTIVVNTLLALDDFTEETGATLVVPESHKWQRPVEQDTDFRVVEMPAGSMLLIDGSLWHNNGANTTLNRHRKALNSYYSSRLLKPVGGMGLGLCEDEIAQLDKPLRALIS